MKLPSLMLASIALLWCFTSTARAADVTPEQARTMCKVVDQTFLHQLPVIMELKAKGLSARTIRVIDRDANSTYQGLMRSNFGPAVEDILDSPTATPEQAIQYLESACIKKLL